MKHDISNNPFTAPPIRCLILLFLALIPLSSFAQDPLARYLEEGISNNLVLQQRAISLEQSLYALKEANRMFMPSVSLLGDYFTADGGRSIDIPVGDLMNPVYSTLNQLTGTQAFPQIENSSTQFLPENYYDGKVRAIVPVYNSQLIYNRGIRENVTLLRESEVEVYRRELVEQIETAYFRYLGALKGVSIYESAVSLAAEGKRINESLVANGKSLPAYVLRSESELQTLRAKQREAALLAENARLYFNFLLNTDPARSIDTVYASEPGITAIEQLISAPADISRREELSMLQTVTRIRDQELSLSKAFWHPRLNGFADLGSQASDWDYSDDSRYYMIGVQLEIPIFSSGKNHFRVKQSEAEYRKQLLENNHATRQIQLSAEVARNELQVALVNYRAALKQLESAEAYNRLIDRGYREGVNSFIETIDARNQLTIASVQVVIDRFTLLGKLSSYKREISQ
jgi:outer membrane protein TolC